MENYIRKYDNVVDDKFCDNLIQQFDSCPEQYEKQSQGEMSFTQIHLLANPVWETEVAYLVDVFKDSIKRYRKDCNIGYDTNIWPQKYGFEGPRLKRYLPDGVDQFGNHVDVADHESARRFLVFFLYLDDNDGGATTFPDYGFTSPCKKGSLLMFPPLWPWMHAGKKPIDKPKYILGSYLNYV
jgi:hypothetical protein